MIFLEVMKKTALEYWSRDSGSASSAISFPKGTRVIEKRIKKVVKNYWKVLKMNLQWPNFNFKLSSIKISNLALDKKKIFMTSKMSLACMDPSHLHLTIVEMITIVLCFRSRETTTNILLHMLQYFQKFSSLDDHI